MQMERLRPVYASSFCLMARRVGVEISDLPQLKAGAGQPGLPETLQTMPIALVSDQSSGREILNVESVQAELDVRPHTTAIHVLEIDRDALSPSEYRFIVFFYTLIEPILSAYKKNHKCKKGKKRTASEECAGVIRKLLNDEDLLYFCLNTVLPKHRTVTAAFARLLFNDGLAPSSFDKAVNKAKNKSKKGTENNESSKMNPVDRTNQDYEPLFSSNETDLVKNEDAHQTYEDGALSSEVDNDRSLVNDEEYINDLEPAEDIRALLDAIVDRHSKKEKPKKYIKDYISFK